MDVFAHFATIEEPVKMMDREILRCGTSKKCPETEVPGHVLSKNCR